MSMNIDDMYWHDLNFGKAALKKLGSIPDNFRLFRSEWLGEFPNCHGMQVTGAEFERMKRKTTHGKKIKGTERSVYVSKEEIQEQKC